MSKIKDWHRENRKLTQMVVPRSFDFSDYDMIDTCMAKDINGNKIKCILVRHKKRKPLEEAVKTIFEMNPFNN